MLDIYKKVVGYPGDMAFAHDRGHFPGVAVKMFPAAGAADGMNEWAKANPMFVVIEVLVTGPSVLVFYTRQVSPEEENDLNEVAREVDALMQKRRAERAEAATKTAELAKAAEREQVRLAELGRRCEENHGKKLTMVKLTKEK